jgi:prephenate dehydrogenase
MGALTPTRIAIVGRGLIGRSIELGLLARGASVVAALDRGDDLSPVREAGLVVLAAPVLENIRLLEAIAPLLSPAAVVTDTGSTKTAIVCAAAGVRFVGGHPVTGGTAAGPSAARPDLFEGQRWILTPGDAVDDAAVETVQVFVESLGAVSVRLSPGDHDRIFAAVSHLPQLVISALMQQAGESAGREGLGLAGPGLRDSTRLASSPPGIWRDILATNHSEIAAALDRLIGDLQRLRDDRDGGEVTRIFERAAFWKAELDERPI